jgi:FKBP-type peptidyl-prolyl cis-trans isomerase (trigger factor)
VGFCIILIIMPNKSTSKTNKKTVKKQSSFSSVMAKTNDGSIQITYKLPFESVKKEREKAAKKLGEKIQIKGFRKGKAPLEKVMAEIPQNDLVQETLSDVLPQLLSDVINNHKVSPATYPKFELLKAEENVDWEVRIITCEIPEIELTHYKKVISDAAKSDAIWTPSSAKASEDKPDKEVTREEKEQEVIKILLETIKFDIPLFLINEEVNQKLSQLLDRLEKLGVDLESYLKSIGKTADQLRADYAKQAKDTLSLDIILTKISDKEGLRATDEEIEAAIKATASDPKLSEKLNTPEQKSYIRAILTKRKALDSLISLM